VLDPYWFTTTRSAKGNGPWGRTLGTEQYQWLAKTLERSNATFKFVFIHNLVGGFVPSMRGGAEAAKYFEWGGYDQDGRYAFDEQRPGWFAPIHALFKRHGVNIVFHGHDHFFARQELDGVVYQLVPQPAHAGGRDVARMATEYGYASGDFLPSPGYVRVKVDSGTTTVSYIRTLLATAGSSDGRVPEVAFEYRLSAGGNTVATGENREQ